MTRNASNKKPQNIHIAPRQALCKLCRHLLALGVLTGLTTGVAHAERPVITFHGLIDVWLGAQQFPGGERDSGFHGGGLSTSYLGVGAGWNLGQGYKVVGALEGFVRVEDGKFGRFEDDWLFSRNAYAGVESPYGTVIAGRLTTALFISTIQFNPFGDSYVFSPMVAHTFLGLGTFPPYPTFQGVVGDSGWNRALSYTTPNLLGLTTGVTYAFNDKAGDNYSKKWSGQANYARGAFSAALVYQYANFNVQPGDLGFKSQDVTQLGAAYDLGSVKLFGQYMRTRNTGQGGNGWHVDTAQAGASLPLGKGSVLASYTYSRERHALNQTRRTWALGYTYPLIKPVDVYAANMNDHLSGLSSGNTIGVGLRARF